ncbi:hypothetical protein Tco_1498672, partial [Tanacetum coccineum]
MLLIQDVVASFDSAVHRVHAVSFDAAPYFVPAAPQSSCFSCMFLLAVQEVPADYVSADHVLNSADRYRIC